MGIVHRDLKPENILLASPAEDAPLKICDFGLSKRVDVAACAAGRSLLLLYRSLLLLYRSVSRSLLTLGGPGRERLWSKCGSPDYVAPEVLGASGYGPGCDVWSCGVILYVLLSGNAPFGQTSIAVKLQHVRRAEFSFPDAPWRSISLSAQDLVKRMMEPEVTARYSCCE
jgi:serine/threonine protein kinase